MSLSSHSPSPHYQHRDKIICRCQFRRPSAASGLVILGPSHSSPCHQQQDYVRSVLVTFLTFPFTPLPTSGQDHLSSSLSSHISHVGSIHPEAVAFVTLSPLIIRSCRFCHPFRSYHIPFTRPRGAQGMSRAVMCQLVLPFPLTIASPESGFPWVLVVTVGWSSGDIPVSPIRIMLW